MDITWYGLSCFRLRERNLTTVVTDPFDAHIGLPRLGLKADVVTVSHPARGHDNISAVSDFKYVLRGPGEYEIGGVFITAVATATSRDGKQNVLFVFNYDGITIAHLGDMVEVPPQAQIEALEQVNVLLAPVGGGSSLNAAQAAELVSMLEPNIVVPMHYHIKGLELNLESVEKFLNEMGVAEAKEEELLRITSSTFAEETEVVILSPRSE
jgi:L-ascorbate metabolism protein UlaG (beta-lactamase superfamily)